MPRFADMIATMPTEELRNTIESMKEERETLHQEYDAIYEKWMKGGGDLSVLCHSLNTRVGQLDRKIHKAIVERGMRDIRETR